MDSLNVRAAVFILCFGAVPLAMAEEFEDYARVTKVTPQIEEGNQPRQDCGQGQRQECQTVDHWQTRANGYAVTYEYRGRRYTTVLPHDPGDRLKVRISVTPEL